MLCFLFRMETYLSLSLAASLPPQGEKKIFVGRIFVGKGGKFRSSFPPSLFPSDPNLGEERGEEEREGGVENGCGGGGGFMNSTSSSFPFPTLLLLLLLKCKSCFYPLGPTDGRTGATDEKLPTPVFPVRTTGSGKKDPLPFSCEIAILSV